MRIAKGDLEPHRGRAREEVQPDETDQAGCAERAVEPHGPSHRTHRLDDQRPTRELVRMTSGIGQLN